MAFKCPKCEFIADKKSQLLQQQQSANHWRSYNCEICGARFTRKANLDRHLEKNNNSNSVHCQECGRSFSRPDVLQRHLQQKHQIGSGQKRSVDNIVENLSGRVIERLKKDDDPRQYYILTKIKSQQMEKFKTVAVSYKITFKYTHVQ